LKVPVVNKQVKELNDELHTAQHKSNSEMLKKGRLKDSRPRRLKDTTGLQTNMRRKSFIKVNFGWM